jgi:galactokinase
LKIQSDSLASLETRFRRRFGDDGAVQFAAAPGRVNLIGEHTDYNDGFVLPMAIEREVVVAFRRRSDNMFAAHSVAFDEDIEVDLSVADAMPPRGWGTYVAGIARAMQGAGLDVNGVECMIDSDVPVGSGLSSSAALEMAVGRTLFAVSRLEWEPRTMARLGQRSEHEFVGIKCGLMDQLASALGESGYALLIDCRSMEARSVPIPEGARVVVMDTGARRALAGSEYNDRRESCEAAVSVARRHQNGIAALRDVSPELLDRIRPELDETTWRRARHVVEENLRPSKMAVAFERGDLTEAGRLMDDSHASLRDLYDVSSEELDLMSGLARRHPACYGARLTGAGFGGCAVALVDTDATDSFIADVHGQYRQQVDLPSELFACAPAAGARLVHQDVGEAGSHQE